MATKSSRTPNKKQSTKKRSPNRGNKANSREKLDKARAKAHAAVERNYRKKLRQLEKIGAYKPETKRLTKWRKAVINKHYRKFEEFLFGDHYIFVPIPTRSKKKRAATIKLAKKNQLPTAPKGVFIAKTKNTKSAVAVYSKRTKTYRIKIRKVKKGLTGRKTVTEIIPIEPMGTLENELDRIEEDADLLQLKKDESLAFKVEMAGGEGYGHQIFSDPAKLRNYLGSQYHQAMAHKLAFYRAVSVFKTKRETYFSQHPRPDSNPYKSRVDKTGRSVLKRNVRQTARSKYMTPWEQGYASYNSGFGMDQNPYPFPPERRQWQNGWLQAKADDGK
jgi:ribosome modulation factor